MPQPPPPGGKRWLNRFGWLILIWALGVGFMFAAAALLKMLMRLAAA
jgi:hypothetical protein